MPPTATETQQIKIEALGDPFAVLAQPSIDYYWDNAGRASVLLTAALICEMLAGAHGGNEIAVVSLGDGVSLDRSAMAPELRRRAHELRRRYLLGDPAAGTAFSAAVPAVWADSEGAFTASLSEFG